MRKQLLLMLTAGAVLLSIRNASASNPNAGAASYNGQKISLKEGSYMPGIIIVKLKGNVRSACFGNSVTVPSLNDKFAHLRVTEIKKMFPDCIIPTQERTADGRKLVDLSLVYQIKVADGLKMENALALLRSDINLEYAEPKYYQYEQYTPNDPLLSSQYALNDGTGGVHAYSAWNVWQGDTNTVIGIVDTGTDWDHPDLAGNIKYNYADTIDGIDNDGDGFVDNYRGWDVAMNDNDPMVVASTHGSHVSGCADAVTDNGVGVAGPAFHCKFLPVKIADDATGALIAAYEGIQYAADHGVNVINCSWGRAGGPSQAEQDVINYAAVNHDITVCCAAGNNSADQAFEPTQYDNVIAVAATTSTDGKASYSNYGYWVDVCAPGDNIYSTVYNNTYTTMSGTSMASPCAAGCAAMIKSRFPSYTQEQVAMRLRTTCDNIYGVAGNSTYSNKLGKGRVNLYNAMTDTTSPGVRMTLRSVTDNNDNVFLANDTLRMVILFKNLLHPTSSAAVATITLASLQATLIGSNSFPVGVLNTFDTISNYAVAFQYKVKPTAPINTVLPFKVTITDGAYSDFFAYNVVVNVDYVNVDVNDIATTQTSRGRVGYTDIGISTGLGFKYMGGATNLYEMGLMVYQVNLTGSDCVRNQTGTGQNTDFGYPASPSGRVVQSLSPLSDFFAQGVLNESGTTDSLTLGIGINHYTYAWITNPDRKYIIVEYVIKNNNATALTNLSAGLFSDWDVVNMSDTSTYASDRDSVDYTRKMGIAWNTRGDGIWCSAKLLSHNLGFNHYAIDNDGDSSRCINAYTGLNRASKYLGLSTSRDVAGWETADGDDISDITGTGTFTIAAGDSVRVAFALIACENLSCLLASADAAQIKYDDMYPAGITNIDDAAGFNLGIYPNPANNVTSFQFSLTENSNVQLSMFNTLGEQVKLLVNERMTKGNHKIDDNLSALPEGSYIVRLSIDGKSEMQRMVIVR